MSNVELLFDKLENSRLTINHYKVIAAAIVGDLLEFFDFFLIGYVLAFIIVPWKLSYTETSIVLLSAGLGAMIGAAFFGVVADRIGRRPVFMVTVLLFSVATGFMYFTPEGNWIYLTVFRFFVGFGLGGLYTVDLPLVQEFVPSRHRGRISGIITSCVPIGTMLGSVLAAYATPFVGWRGLFIIGLLPAFLTLLIRAWVPESPRWLLSRGRLREAENAINWVIGEKTHFTDSVGTAGTVAAEAIVIKSDPRPNFLDLFKYPRSLIVSWITNLGQQICYYGFTLWGPTILVLVLGIPAIEAAKMFISVTICGFVGRLCWAYLSDILGRRACGFLIGLGGCVLTILAGVNYNSFIGNTSLIWAFMVAAYFFVDGGFAIVGPYGSEVWPRHLRATGMGSAYGFGGLGKIIGPIALAFFAGSSNVVSPKATIDAIIPAFIFMGAWEMITGITFLFGMETKKKSIEEIDAYFQAADEAAEKSRLASVSAKK
ncbi:MAG: MFS transporter [Negativicutes bacterium]|nr:MFS transporter [Negativicutes bacterium]